MHPRYKAQVEKGLSRLLAFLREEEERERLEEIERLKPIGTPVGSYLEYRCVRVCVYMCVCVVCDCACACIRLSPVGA